MSRHSVYTTFDIISPPGQTSSGPFFNTVCDYIRWVEGSATGRTLLPRLDGQLHQQNLLLRIEQVPQSPAVPGFKVWGPANTRLRMLCAHPYAPVVAPWHTSAVPLAIYFAHELIHALHWMQHRHNADRDAEEWATIGLGRYAPNPFIENRIRCERGLPLRTSHADQIDGHTAQDEIDRFHRQGYADPVCRNARYEHPLRTLPSPATRP